MTEGPGPDFDVDCGCFERNNISHFELRSTKEILVFFCILLVRILDHSIKIC